MRRFALSALSAAALLAACTTLGPDYRRPAIALPDGYQYAPATPAAQPGRDWWTLFGDAELERLVRSALARNADARQAAARLREAEAALREAGAAFYPDVSGGYSFSRNRVSTEVWPPPPSSVSIVRPLHQLVASTSYEIDFWGRIARANEAAGASYLATRYGRDVTELTLAGATAQAYFALRSLDAQVEVLARTIATRADSLALARARLTGGLAPELDVHQAQAALADAQAQQHELQRQRAVVERQLGQLAGEPALALAPGSVVALPLPPVPPPGLPSTLLDRRPDIRAAEQNLVAANAQIGIARAALFPTLALTATAGSQSVGFADLLARGSAIWTLGYGLTLPIFDAGRRDARVEQAQAREQQALAGYQRAVETGFREVSEALINLTQGAVLEQDLETRRRAAQQALELSRLRYEAGYSPYLEVLDAQRSANDADLAFVRNRQARLAWGVDLIKALGGGWADAK